MPNHPQAATEQITLPLQESGEFDSALKPEYARILQTVPASESQKTELVHHLHTVVRQIVRTYLDETLKATENDPIS